MTEREEALEAVYESAKARTTMPKEDFLALLEGWDVHPVRVNGVIVGAVCVNGEMVHACIKPEGFKRWLSKGVLQRTLVDVINTWGRAVTSVAKGNVEGERFVARLRFKPFKEENNVVWYEVS